MKSLLVIPFLLLASLTAKGQNTDLISGDVAITWLGIDFTQTRFIGSATQFRDAGEITLPFVLEKYIPGWNGLFVDEQKKYDVAKYVHRPSVSYAMEVTAKANSKVGPAFFSMNPDDFSRMDEAEISRIVKKYDFMGKKGVGLIFFVEGMSKGLDQASAWITFVDMGKRTVLQTRRATGKAGGFGFRNYWAKAFFNILKETDGSR